jgi:hypothetical protein
VSTLTPRGAARSVPAKVGDIWYRVEGSHIGDEVYEGMELAWTSWICVKTTPSGAWFRCVEWRHVKQRFALTLGARAISRSRREALERLVARKVCHLRRLAFDTTVADDTLALARAALESTT